MKKGMETHWRHQAFPPPPSGGRGQGAGGEAAATTYPPGVYQDTPHILRFPPRLSARYRSRDYAQGRGQVDPPPLGTPAPTGHRPAHRARPPRGGGHARTRGAGAPAGARGGPRTATDTHARDCDQGAGRRRATGGGVSRKPPPIANAPEYLCCLTPSAANKAGRVPPAGGAY